LYFDFWFVCVCVWVILFLSTCRWFFILFFFFFIFLFFYFNFFIFWFFDFLIFICDVWILIFDLCVRVCVTFSKHLSLIF
jgi:hypothetical protein